MRVERVRIENFRSIEDMTVELGDLTILIGANGTGKTTVLDALGLFGSDRPSVAYDDFGRKSNQIRITLSIKVDGHGVPDRFLHDGVVELQRSFTRGRTASGSMMAATMRNKDFDKVRDAATVAERKAEIRSVQKAYPGFPSYTNMKKWGAELADYEHRLSRSQEHSNKYRRKFVGISKDEIDQSKILEVVTVPATRDITGDAEEGSNSHLSKLMDLAIRSAQENDDELKKIAIARDDAYTKYMNSIGNTIRDLNGRLGYHSGRYMTGAEFTIDQEYPAQPPANPDASVRMKDDEYMVPISKAGSGAQRVYLLSLLDTIASILREAREKDQGQDRALPIRLIAIDEPELYQHPQRQRQILRSLMGMANDPAVCVVCCTHSPYFVNLKSIHTLRLLRKTKKYRIRSVTPERLANLLLSQKKVRRPGGAGELSKWLDMSATHWVTEGFFARLVVIVEGQGDRSMLLAIARAADIDLGAHEITVIPAVGFENVEKFARLFREFKIPVYLVWDRDLRWRRDKNEAHAKDRGLAALASEGIFSGSLGDTVIESSFSCVRDNLTAALVRDLCECEDLLGGSAQYKELKKAVEQDELSTTQGGKKCRRCGADQKRPAGQKVVYKAQKDFLNNRLNVLNLLEAVLEKDPKKLNSFTHVRIVREIEKAGRLASRHIARAIHDEDSGTLRVEFRSGDVYEYQDVPREAYVGLQGATSMDKYYHMNVKNRYGYTRIS